MAETLTLNNDAPQEEGLSAEEQDSLQVGEKLVTEQQQLLAGKYKNAEELEQAYVELQKKLGDNDNVAEQEESKTEEEPEEEPTEIKAYNDDGSVNYESVKENYGETLSNLFKEKNVDPYTISKHFHENNGNITQEMYDQLLGTGLSKQAIDSYLTGRAEEMGYNSDLQQSDIDTIKKSVGGEDQYKALMDWAGQNLSQDSIESFDHLINTGDKNSIQMAVDGLVARYQNENGYEGRMLQGKPSKSNTDVYASQAQLVEAMSDPRYDRDPAYRQQVIAKLERSDIQF
jgi:hypothetical protein